MLLLAIYAGCAIAIGLIALVREPRMPTYWPLLVVAALPQIALVYGIAIPGSALISLVLVGAWGALDRAVSGAPLISIGMLANLLAMALHGGRMPIHADLVAGLGDASSVGAALAGSKDVVVSGSPILWLSDQFQISFQHITLIASPGDIVVVAGILWWLFLSTPAQRSRDHAYTPTSIPAQDGAPAVPPRR